MSKETRWLDDQEQQLWRTLREFLWQFPSAMDRQLSRDSAMQSGEYSVLAALSEAGGPLRPATLAGELVWDRSRLSHLLRRMENKGLVLRCTDTEDGRGQLVSLTDEGWQAIRSAAPAHVTFIRQSIFDHLDDTEREMLERVLHRVLGSVRDASAATNANC
ncbi:MarR family winged helix-turn-helix transcriptional regulator [Glutamicibacter uratoxydans]|uniref:MarR family winged helix-turn-helix transcriptional regulator n=1 Tax=Glutamicibacter uratoxydans TaxID=43667 RepID=UPI003D6F8632